MITHTDANFSYRQKGIYPSKNYYARLVQLKTSFFLDLNLLRDWGLEGKGWA